MIDEDTTRHELLRELEQDTSITDNLLDYAAREELDEFHRLLSDQWDLLMVGTLLRRVHRRAILQEFDRQIEDRIQQVREETA